MSKNTGIPTAYAGVNFRSRIEAKWAAFFDLVCWRWTYEPLDYPGWIPDFLIEEPFSTYGDNGVLIEVKPEDKWDACAAELSGRAMWRLEIPYDIVICGHSPFLRGNSFDQPVMGLHSAAIPDPVPAPHEWLRGSFNGDATVFRNGAWGLAADYPWRADPGDLARALKLWRQAGNMTQWAR